MPPSLVLALLASASVSLEPSAAARELAPLLVQELGDLAASTSTTAHFVSLRELDAHLALELRTAGGEPLLVRSFALAAGRAAALRGVVVAIVQALAVEASTAPAVAATGTDRRPTVDAGPDRDAAAPTDVQRPPAAPPGTRDAATRDLAPTEELEAPELAVVAPDPITSEAAALDGATGGAFPAGLSLGLSGGVVVAAGPQLLLEVDARWPLTPTLALGASLAAHGLLCCTTTDALGGGTPGLRRELRRAEALVLVAWQPLALGPLELGVAGGVGGVWQSLEATPLTFVGSAPTHALELWSPAARLALEATMRVGPAWSPGTIAWTLGLGAELSGGLSTGLPSGFPGQGLTVETGIIHPFAYLRAQLGLL
jgi:hypothetical protein